MKESHSVDSEILLERGLFAEGGEGELNRQSLGQSDKERNQKRA